MFSNPDFVRGKYSMLVRVKKRLFGVNGESDNVEETRAEYIKLRKNYEELWKAAYDLKGLTADLVTINKGILLEELNKRFDFIERVKCNLIGLAIQSVSFDNSINNKIIQRIEENTPLGENFSAETGESPHQSVSSGDMIKHQAHTAFFVPSDRSGHISKVLRTILKSLNERFFCVNTDEFNNSVVRYFLRDEQSLSLVSHTHFGILYAAKQLFEQFCAIVIGDYLPDVMVPLYMHIQAAKDIEVLKAETLPGGASVTDSCSVRTLKDLAGGMGIDFFSNLKSDFD